MSNIDFEKELWFEIEGHCEGKHYIFGNPHTFTGRISAYCPQKNVIFNVSLNEIINMSQESKYWIKGFLSGNEPAPPVDEEGDLLPPSDEEYINWERSIELFHKTGYWYAEDRFCEVCEKKILYSWNKLKCDQCYNG